MTIFTMPVRLAVQMGIPLIVWGENSQNEYGGPAAAATDNTSSRAAGSRSSAGCSGCACSDLVGPGRHRAEAPHAVHLSVRRRAARASA